MRQGNSGSQVEVHAAIVIGRMHSSASPRPSTAMRSLRTTGARPSGTALATIIIRSIIISSSIVIVIIIVIIIVMIKYVYYYDDDDDDDDNNKKYLYC